MEIRHARMEELDPIMALYDIARGYMRESGNFAQWTDGYPSREMIAQDIEKNKCYVCLSENGICAAFFYDYGRGIDPDYAVIEGAWLNAEPYGVLHRLGVSERGRGIAAFCYETCLGWHPNLRLDTHPDNIPMQKSLKKNGFSYCGKVNLAGYGERIAFQKIIEE